MDDQSGWKGQNPANSSTRERKKMKKINDSRNRIPRDMSNSLSKILMY